MYEMANCKILIVLVDEPVIVQISVALAAGVKKVSEDMYVTVVAGEIVVLPPVPPPLMYTSNAL